MNKNISVTGSGSYGNYGYNKEDSNEDQYPQFEKSLQRFFDEAINGGKKLFTTDVNGLKELYLANLPVDARAHYTCNGCFHFLERFGGLVTIDENGNMESAIWNEVDTPRFFAPVVRAMREAVLRSRVNGVFIPDARVLGTPKTGEWTHMHIRLPQEMTNKSVLRTAYQVMAEKKEDFKMLMNALLTYSADVAEQALNLLQTESLSRSEKTLGVARWFSHLHDVRNSVRNSRNKENIVWLAVATAPAGFCHVRSSMIGTLLDDLASGLSFDVIRRNFAKKMDPMKYQRPQVAPSAGNKAQAEKIVKEMGIEDSLDRRFARLDEIEKAWAPALRKPEVVNSGGVFSHLETKGQKNKPKMDLPPVTMTWRKFSETVLPFAQEIEYMVKSGKDNYTAILTAAHEDAPPILQWDKDEQRNPFSWYVYNGGSPSNQWNLTPGYHKVTGITFQPSMWYEENAHQGKAVFLILEGAKDNRYEGAGNALFPEILRSELREIRSTLEAYSKSAIIKGHNESSACGVRLQYGSPWNTTIRVTTKTGTAVYKLDRWD